MKTFKTLLRLYLKDMFRRRDKKQAAAFIVLGALYVMMVIFAVVGIVFMADSIRESGSIVEVLSGILFLDFSITIVTGTVSAISFLFLSKDNEFFASLPVKQSTVFLAKFVVLLAMEMLVSLVIILPTFLVLGIVMNLGALFYLMIPVVIIAVPIFATVIISLISMPIVWLAGRFKNRGLLKTVLALVVFVGFFAVYFIAINTFTGGGDIDLSGLGFTNYIIYPLFMLMHFATRTPIFNLGLTHSMLVSFASFIVPIIVFFIVSYILSMALYQKIIRNSLEFRGNVTNKSGNFVSGTARGAIIKKEWRMIIRDTSVALNTIAMIFLAPIVIIVSSAGMSAGFGDVMGAGTAALMEWSVGIMMMMIMAVGLNGSSSSISREGAWYYYMKMLPVSFKDQIRAKQNFYNIISVISIAVSLTSMIVFSIIRGNFIWWVPLLVGVGAFVWSVAITNLSIYFDLRSPKLDWRNIREVVKRFKNSAVYIVWLVVGMFVFSGLLGGVAMSEEFGMNAQIFMAVYLGVFAFVGVVLAFLFDRLLIKNADRLFRAL